MKILLLLLILTGVAPAYAQTDPMGSDTIAWVNKEYMQNIYNPKTKTANPSYNYSEKWDLDGDNKKDSVLFIGDGAVHTFFYLRIILSTDHVIRDFPFIQLDMPYFEKRELLEKYGRHTGLQFVVDDFDKDGIQDLYVNFNGSFGIIPRSWRKKGVTSKYVIMSFAGSKLKVRNY